MNSVRASAYSSPRGCAAHRPRTANFTEAAHERNYEAGVLVRDTRIASALAQQFESLAVNGDLQRLAQ